MPDELLEALKLASCAEELAQKIPVNDTTAGYRWQVLAALSGLQNDIAKKLGEQREAA